MAEKGFGERLCRDARKARGDKGDEDWVARAVIQLVIREGVSDDAAERALGDVIALVHETGESAESLFGSPPGWAAEQAARWREDDAEVFGEEQSSSLRSAVILSLAGAAVIAVLFAAVWAVDEWPRARLSPAFYLFPWGLAVLGQGVPAVFAWGQRRFGPLGAVLAASATLVGGAGVMAGCAAALNPVKHEVHVVWLFAVPVVYAVLAWLVSVLWRDRAAPDGPRRPRQSGGGCGFDGSESEWANIVVSYLRFHAGYSAGEAESAVTEARAHAQQARTSVSAEFGNPLAYARSLPVSSRRRRQRLIWAGVQWVSLLVVGGLLLAESGLGLNSATLALAVAALAGIASLRLRWREWRDRRRRRGAR